MHINLYTDLTTFLVRLPCSKGDYYAAVPLKAKNVPKSVLLSYVYGLEINYYQSLLSNY